MARRRVVKRSLGGNVFLAESRSITPLTNVIKLFTLCGLLLVLGACATRVVDAPSQEPAEVEDRAVVDGEVLPLPEQGNVKAEPLQSAPAVSPVVMRLMASARSQSEQGDLDAAASSLERALRIESRNAMLWARLADVRYAQRAWRKSIQLAAKSNTLAASNQDLRRRNWYLMANAYQVLGDENSAQKFRMKLNQ